MGLNGFYRLIMLILAVAIVACAAMSYVGWKGMREENAERQMVAKKLSDHVEKLRRDKQYKNEYYYRLLHDDKFADRIIREKLGFVSKNEIVFRFKDSDTVTIDKGEGVAGAANAVNATVATSSTSVKSGTENSDMPDLAAEFEDEEVSEGHSQESILSKMMFWKRSSADANAKQASEPDAAPQIRIDILEQSAEKNKAVATQTVTNSNGVSIKFDFDTSKSSSDSPSIPTSLAVADNEFISAHQQAGMLVDTQKSKSTSVKLGSSNSVRAVNRSYETAEKVIRFRAN